MRGALIVATIAVPLYTALLHAWIYAYRRRDTVHLWLAVSALGVTGIATGIAARTGATTPVETIYWQAFEMAGGALLLIGFVRWCHALLGLSYPRVERAADVFGGVVLLSIAADGIYSDATVWRHSVSGGRIPEALLAPFGYVLVAVFGLFSFWLMVQLGRHVRSHPAARAPFAAYCCFWVTLVHDIAVGANLVDAPQILAFGYLAMLVGLSAGLVGDFVHSMRDAARRATDLHVRVTEHGEELRRKERQLVHGERLAALGTLAAGVAHEINDPLAFVSSNLNRVEEIWSHPAERRDIPEILDECHEGLARLRGTVAELLRLARRSESETVPLDVAEIVASVLPLVRAEGRFRARWTEFLTAVPAVRGDPGLLTQVALQLLLNAIRSVPEGAPGDHQIHVSTGCEGGRVCLRVRDSGPPIPAAELPHLFDPFASLTAEREALRLGLAVTHQIVTSHGGDIDVESDERGTEVTVWLPVAPRADAPVRRVHDDAAESALDL
jgi:signal transduction histidine kinase